MIKTTTIMTKNLAKLEALARHAPESVTCKLVSNDKMAVCQVTALDSAGVRAVERFLGHEATWEGR